MTMKLKKSGLCPCCQKQFKDIEIDFGKCRVRCPTCQTEFYASEVLSDYELLHLAELIPPEERSAFLTKLGFEQKPVRRTPRILVIGFIAFLAFAIVATVILHVLYEEKRFGTLLLPLAGALLIWGVIRMYKEEEKPRWRRKKLVGFRT